MTAWDDVTADAPEGHGLDVGFMAKFGLHIETMAAQLKRQNDLQERFFANQPVADRLTGQGTVPSGGAPIVFPLGTTRTPQGMRYEFRSIWIGSNLVNEVPAGDAYLFVGGAPPTDLGSTTAVDQYLLGLPTRGYWSSGQLTVNQSEQAYLAIIGGGAGVQYVANARVWAFSDSAHALQTITS